MCVCQYRKQSVVRTYKHSVQITEIYSQTFLAKLSWKQCFYQEKLLNSWFDEIFFILPCDVKSWVWYRFIVLFHTVLLLSDFLSFFCWKLIQTLLVRYTDFVIRVLRKITSDFACDRSRFLNFTHFKGIFSGQLEMVKIMFYYINQYHWKNQHTNHFDFGRLHFN